MVLLLPIAFVAGLVTVLTPCILPVLPILLAGGGTGGRPVAIAIAYALGAALPMLAVARGGTELGRRLRAHAPAVRVAAGVVIAAAALGISQGWATALQKSVPSWAQAIQDAVEGNAFAKRHLAKLQDVPVREEVAGLSDYGRAPDFQGISHWLNARPLTLSSL